MSKKLVLYIFKLFLFAELEISEPDMFLSNEKQNNFSETIIGSY